jgi:hypothetical protein
MIDLAGAAADLADTLTAAGIPATVDVRDLNPPAVLIPPPELVWRFGKGAVCTWRIVAAAPNTGTGPAVGVLSDLVDRVQDALAGAVTGGRPVDLTDPLGGAPLPGYELTLETRRPEQTTVAPTQPKEIAR